MNSSKKNTPWRTRILNGALLGIVITLLLLLDGAPRPAAASKASEPDDATRKAILDSFGYMPSEGSPDAVDMLIKKQLLAATGQTAKSCAAPGGTCCCGDPAKCTCGGVCGTQPATQPDTCCQK